MTSDPPKNLIIVCCHGIWLGGPSLGHDEGEWLIAGFQKGETPTFIEHIKAGLHVLKDDANSILMFSGWVLSPHSGHLKLRSNTPSHQFSAQTLSSIHSLSLGFHWF